MTDDLQFSEEELAQYEEAIREFNKLVPEHLRPIFHDSRLRESKRGIRRYFPLTVTSMEGWEYLYEAFFMFYGRRPIDNEEVMQAIVKDKLDRYIEEYNGKLWVRTIIYC